MVLATSVLIEVVAIGVILRTFDTIKVAETREVFSSLAFLVLGEMSRRLQVGFDLIEITIFVSEKVGGSWLERHRVRRLVLLRRILPMMGTIAPLLSSKHRAACSRQCCIRGTKIGLVSIPWPE